MSAGEPPKRAQRLLAFVERYWRELTLRDARSLCVEIVDSLPPALALRLP
jgi:hypothetical protein